MVSSASYVSCSVICGKRTKVPKEKYSGVKSDFFSFVALMQSQLATPVWHDQTHGNTNSQGLDPEDLSRIVWNARLTGGESTPRWLFWFPGMLPQLLVEVSCRHRGLGHTDL